jgi:hypothetical protein
VEEGGGSGAGLRNVVLAVVLVVLGTIDEARSETFDICFLTFDRDWDDLTLATHISSGQLKVKSSLPSKAPGAIIPFLRVCARPSLGFSAGFFSDTISMGIGDSPLALRFPGESP